MAYQSVRIDQNAGVALVEVGGEVVAADIVDAARALHALPAWNDQFHVIWDGRAITSLVIGHEEVIGMVDAKMEDSVGKEVTIATRDLDQMMASLCALLLQARGREAKVVTSLEEALDELGLDQMPVSLKQVAS